MNHDKYKAGPERDERPRAGGNNESQRNLAHEAGDDKAPRDLAPQHAKLIKDSAIDPEVARERGYRTVTVKTDLMRLGFGRNQALVPGLLIPVHGVTGGVAGYQLRPDTPRIRDGKPLRYESPAGSRVALDVPRRARERLGDPGSPLFVTEGARKADSAVSRGLCCVALLGVWNWRGTNGLGGKTALPEWESVALNDREVFIVFDSDVMTKPAVASALARLKAFLESRGAHVRVIYILPAAGGTKCGLDDFFVAGGTVQGLLALASDEVRRPPQRAATLHGTIA